MHPPHPQPITRRRFLRTTGAAAASVLMPPRWLWAAEDPFAKLDATAQAELVRKKDVSPLELVDAAIRRVEALNPQLNAFVTTCFERARDQSGGSHGTAIQARRAV